MKALISALGTATVLLSSSVTIAMESQEQQVKSAEFQFEQAFESPARRAIIDKPSSAYDLNTNAAERIGRSRTNNSVACQSALSIESSNRAYRRMISGSMTPGQRYRMISITTAITPKYRSSSMPTQSTAVPMYTRLCI